MRAVITASPPAWTSSAAMLSTPADFPFFNDCTAASTLCEGWGGHPLCLSGDSSVLMDLHWPLIVLLRAVFCPSVQYLSVPCEAFSWTILDRSRFPLFHSGQVFHQLVCPLTVVLPQIFFNLTNVLLFSFLLPFSCTSWCYCSLPCISQILQVRIFSFSVPSFCRGGLAWLKKKTVQHSQTWLRVQQEKKFKQFRFQDTI